MTDDADGDGRTSLSLIEGTDLRQRRTPVDQGDNSVLNLRLWKVSRPKPKRSLYRGPSQSEFGADFSCHVGWSLVAGSQTQYGDTIDRHRSGIHHLDTDDLVTGIPVDLHRSDVLSVGDWFVAQVAVDGVLDVIHVRCRMLLPRRVGSVP
jgi:hypothetical protein